MEKNDDQVFGTYSHMGGRIATLVVLEGANEEVAKDVAMHAAAMNPSYINPSQEQQENKARTQEHQAYNHRNSRKRRTKQIYGNRK